MKAEHGSGRDALEANRTKGQAIEQRDGGIEGAGPTSRGARRADLQRPAHEKPDTVKRDRRKRGQSGECTGAVEDEMGGGGGTPTTWRHSGAVECSGRRECLRDGARDDRGAAPEVRSKRAGGCGRQTLGEELLWRHGRHRALRASSRHNGGDYGAGASSSCCQCCCCCCAAELWCCCCGEGQGPGPLPAATVTLASSSETGQPKFIRRSSRPHWPARRLATRPPLFWLA